MSISPLDETTRARYHRKEDRRRQEDQDSLGLMPVFSPLVSPPKPSIAVLRSRLVS